MPSRSTRQDTDRSVRIGLAPDGTGGLGALGLDLLPREGMISPFALTRAERVRLHTLALTRALGPKRIYVPADNTGSRLFAADTKYAKVTAAAQLLVPKGSWGVHWSFTAVRPAAGKTAYLNSNRQNGQAYGVVWATLSDAGLLSVNARWASGTTTTLTTTALTAGAAYHAWLLYDDALGTLTLYVASASVVASVTSSPGTGLQLNQTAAIDWYFGVEWDPATVGVTADTHFDGLLDAFQLRTFRGAQLSAGNPSLLATLKSHIFRQWPNPAEPGVLAQYDFDEASGTTLYDRSRYKNHGTYTGASTASAAVALSRPVGNYVGIFQKANGSRVNLALAGGRLSYETVRTGS